MTARTETIVGKTPTRRRFSIEDFIKMDEAGLFGEGVHVELLDGDVIDMGPKTPLHCVIVAKAMSLLIKCVEEALLVSTQCPLELDSHSLPLPDLYVFACESERHRESYPIPNDVLLLAEVANTSLQYDREIKLPRYAEAGIPEVWIVDLDAQTIEQYTEPRQRKYGRLTTISLGEPIQATQLPGVQFTTDRIFS